MNNHGLYSLVEVGVTLETVEESVLAGRQVELEEQRQRNQAEVQNPKRNIYLNLHLKAKCVFYLQLVGNFMMIYRSPLSNIFNKIRIKSDRAGIQ